MNKIFLSLRITTASFARFSIKEKTLFAKRMSFLIKAGVPLVDSLTLIRTQTKSPTKAKVFDTVIDDVNNGQFLATSLKKHRNLFGDFAINLIRIGEESGILSQNLAYLADELQKKDSLRKKVIGALVYPFIISLATLGITGVLTMYIFPKIMPVFTSLHVPLPLSTRILVAINEYVRHYGLLTFFLITIVGILFFIAQKSFPPLQLILHRTMLQIPIFGKLFRAYNLANFCRTAGLLLKSGVQLSDTMVMVAETTKNLAYRRAFERVAGSVIRGEPMSRQLARDLALFPDMLAHMVTVGETTGSLSTTLLYLSEMYEEDVEELTKNLSNAIEPVLMLVMGVLVGFIAVSIISPIYEITRNLSPR